MKKLKQALHTFLVQDCQRGERWLLVLGAVIAMAARQSLEVTPAPVPSRSPEVEVFVEEASIITPVLSPSDSLLIVAQSLIGVPYRYAGKNATGFDCSGFTSYVFDKIGIGLGASSRQQFQQGQAVGLTNAQPGDLIFFRGGPKVSHVGIVVEIQDEKTMFIHASSSRGVVIDQLETDYYLSRLAGIRRLLPS